VPRYINIPQYPQAGQPRALFDREQEIHELYRPMVQAGNAFCQGNASVRHRHLLRGYRGVGKSSVLVEALSLVRGESARVAVDGRPLVVDLPEPIDPERWLLLRVSGKAAPSFQLFGKALAEASVGDDSAVREPRRFALQIGPEIVREAQEQLPGVTQLSFFDRRLFSKDRALYDDVRTALDAVTLAIQYVEHWLGAVRAQSFQSAAKSDANSEAEARVEAELRGMVGASDRASAKTAASMAARIIVKKGLTIQAQQSLEQRRLVDVDVVVDAFNELFSATRKARLPTILAIDDLDDFTAEQSPSYEQRASMLNLVLGPLCELRPTCLIVALRSEYVHEEFTRKFSQTTNVPPMPVAAIHGVLEVWGRIQMPALAAADARTWVDILDPFFAQLGEGGSDARVLIPEAWLGLAQWLYNSERVCAERASARLALGAFILSTQGEITRDAVLSLAELLDLDEARRCLRGEPLESTRLEPSASDRSDLERSGYLRPAMAGDPSDKRIIVHPLVGALALLGEPATP
jgi:hypothetical protein